MKYIHTIIYNVTIHNVYAYNIIIIICNIIIYII